MLIAFLVLLFVVVFVVLAWRIVVTQLKPVAPEVSSFVCPECDDVDCICHKKHP